MGFSFFIRGPEWFFGIDAVLEGLAFIIALFLTIYAYRAYKLTHDKRFSLFALSFLSITLSQGIRALTDTLILTNIQQNMPYVELLPHLSSTPLLFTAGYFLHVFFMLLGLIILVCYAMKIKDVKVFCIMAFSVLPLLLLVSSVYLAFHYLGLLFSAFIAYSYWKYWCAKKTGATCLVSIGFLLMALSYVQFLADTVFRVLYISAHVTQLAGYLCLLAALIMVLRK